VSVYRQPSNFTNGHTRDRQVRLISFEHGTRLVTRTEVYGSITVLADRFEGARLNSPNDVVVKSDGAKAFIVRHDAVGRVGEPDRAV
ncbi:SMP-30/gluconolactonase/LRE family protein, partial [Rhizobium ruizarguesonis]